MKMNIGMNVTSVAKKCILACKLKATGSKVVQFSQRTHYMWKLQSVKLLFVVILIVLFLFSLNCVAQKAGLYSVK